MICSKRGMKTGLRKNWIAFAEKVDSVAEWEEWTGPDDGSFYSRFSGDGSGMEDFTALAESAFLTLSEFDPTSKKSNGFHSWMALLHDMAFKYPTSLLSSEMSIWGVDEGPDMTPSKSMFVSGLNARAKHLP